MASDSIPIPKVNKNDSSQVQLTFSQMRKLNLLNDSKKPNDCELVMTEKLCEQDKQSLSNRSYLSRACKASTEPMVSERPSYERYSGK